MQRAVGKQQEDRHERRQKKVGKCSDDDRPQQLFTWPSVALSKRTKAFLGPMH